MVATPAILHQKRRKRQYRRSGSGFRVLGSAFVFKFQFVTATVRSWFAGRFSDAIESYKQAARLQPKSPEAYYNLALTYREIGNLDMAEAQSKILQRLDGKLYEKLLSEIQR